jgi:RimJ/RimL family protein N-acetyltransferase
MWIEPIVMEDRTVRLEPLVVAHAADLFAAADPELFRHTPQAPTEWTVAGFEHEIARTVAIPATVAFAIVLQTTGRAIGRTTYMDIKADYRGVEIGRTWISRAHHGTSVNPEIKFMMLQHAFERLNPPALRVQFTTGGTNLHSQRAIAKLGAVKEGVLRQARFVRDSLYPATPPMVGDTVVFSIVDHEWPGVKHRLLGRLGRSE